MICEAERRYRFANRLLLLCTRHSAPGYLDCRIDRGFLEEHIDDFAQHFYVCGPPAFVRDVTAALSTLGATADALVFED